MNSFAIAEHHNVAEIYRELDRRVSQPMRPINRTAMVERVAYSEKRCPSSTEIIDVAPTASKSDASALRLS